MVQRQSEGKAQKNYLISRDVHNRPTQGFLIKASHGSLVATKQQTKNEPVWRMKSEQNKAWNEAVDAATLQPLAWDPWRSSQARGERCGLTITPDGQRQNFQ